MSYIYFFVTV